MEVKNIFSLMSYNAYKGLVGHMSLEEKAEFLSIYMEYDIYVCPLCGKVSKPINDKNAVETFVWQDWIDEMFFDDSDELSEKAKEAKEDMLYTCLEEIVTYPFSYVWFTSNYEGIKCNVLSMADTEHKLNDLLLDEDEFDCILEFISTEKQTEGLSSILHSNLMAINKETVESLG